MSFLERKKKILMILDEFDSLSVMEISEKLSISPATVRRDLQDLSEEGVLQRTHGGAMKLDNLPLVAFNKKQTANVESKQEIGKVAAANVVDGDTIFMDCGSTVFAMCAHLKKLSRLKIITNSLPIVAELVDTPGISINLIGGELDKERRAVHGDMAVQHIDTYHATKAFVGVDGISVKNGLTAHSEKESQITKAFLRNAERVYLLTDSSKIGKDAYVKFETLKAIDFLITDTQLEPNLKKEIEEEGVKVLQ
ncbi:DeoR/GlpR family DNA-binding transcription regulator [Pedobacter sp. B4-66]|uniref:DeoR/GlpR family DNA-binding transcription regulator n=1 Tax=Pedobacter sp. B4-66 TaxID=2817280 RepID=UPI001BDB29C2|nr:DeoR/GlpR family DNA-binding transcription regulator [Pedobacter sp. B4-66]